MHYSKITLWYGNCLEDHHEKAMSHLLLYIVTKLLLIGGLGSLFSYDNYYPIME